MLDRVHDSFARAVRNALPWIGYCGIYEYTVFTANPPTYELRPTVPASGLPVFGGDKPDTGPVPVKPGVPGVTSSLAVGALVLVSFIDCDSSRPFIVAVAGPGDAGFTPTSLQIDCSGTITIGASATTLNVGTASLAHVGGTEPSNPATAAGRFVRYGDILVPPTSFNPAVPYTIVPGPTNATMSRAGS